MADRIVPAVSSAPKVDGKIVARSGMQPHELAWHASFLVSGPILLFGPKPVSLAKLGLPDWAFVLLGAMLLCGAVGVIGGVLWRRLTGSLRGLVAEAVGLVPVAFAEACYAVALFDANPSSAYLAYLAIIFLATVGNGLRFVQIVRDLPGEARRRATS